MALPLPSRDSVTTIRDDGSRPFLFPADTHGRFTLARRLAALLLIGFYLSLPWIKIGGYPAVFFDVAERRFHLFGLVLAAQDLWLLFFVISGVGFSLFFITALLGRIWCGWACPHTVFLDHVYRRIERWIDGDAVRRRALAAAPLDGTKLGKRILKHALYLLVSAAIAHLFLAYFVSLPTVWAMVSAAPAEHWSLFVFMAVFTGALYFNFGWFREQLCIVICPYGRLQSALIDNHSLVIGYDATRGEPRMTVSEAHRAQEAQLKAALSSIDSAKAGVPSEASAKEGDCVACNRCVNVCPTGIDIRQGLQMECVGCTACIDACDDVMTRLNRPRGLIRYDSQIAFAGQTTRWLRPRTLVYGLLLVVGACVAGWALSTVRPASLGVTRITGAPYIVSADSIRNQFLVRLVNKRNFPVQFQVSLGSVPPGLTQTGLLAPVEVAPLDEIVQPLVLQQARAAYQGPFILTVRVQDASSHLQLSREVEFLGPDVRLLREEEEENKGARHEAK
ncbi:MAG: cytochrome c oxidase accessory protein CcoG [Opitutaceae bacterium]